MRRFLKRAWLPAASFFYLGAIVAMIFRGYAEVAALAVMAVMAPPVIGLLVIFAVSATEAGEDIADRLGWFDD